MVIEDFLPVATLPAILLLFLLFSTVKLFATREIASLFINFLYPYIRVTQCFLQIKSLLIICTPNVGVWTLLELHNKKLRSSFL